MNICLKIQRTKNRILFKDTLPPPSLSSSPPDFKINDSHSQFVAFSCGKNDIMNKEFVQLHLIQYFFLNFFCFPFFWLSPLFSFSPLLFPVILITCFSFSFSPFLFLFSFSLWFSLFLFFFLLFF